MSTKVSKRIDDLVKQYEQNPLAKHLKKIQDDLNHQSLDDWIALQLSGYEPRFFPQLQLDVYSTEGKVFALFDRAMSRRNELLHLQGQVYLRLLQHDLQVKIRAHTRKIVDASTRVEEAAANKEFAVKAANYFSQDQSPLTQGFSSQSLGMAATDNIAMQKELTRRIEMHSQAIIQETHDDAVNDLHELERGPFDYSRRFDRIRSMYIHDFKSFIDTYHNYIAGLRLLGIDPGQQPAYTSPEFIWLAGEKLQALSRKLYSRKLDGFTRQIALIVGRFHIASSQQADVDFIKLDAQGNSTPLTFSEFDSLLSPLREPSIGDPAPPPWQEPPVNPNDLQWVRLRFSIQKNARFLAAGSGFQNAENFRIQSVGLQWIVNTPTFSEGRDEDAMKENQALEYAMRNSRGIVVPTILYTPQHTDIRFPRGVAQFPTACTTDDGIEKITANMDPMITGSTPFGIWDIDIGKPLRKGRPQSRSAGGGSSTYPSIRGLILYLNVSAQWNVSHHDH